MKQGRRLLVILSVMLWLGGLVSCTPRMAQVKETGLPEIKDIQVTELPSKIEIRVVSDDPLVYTTFQLTDPDRLVVDMAGVDLGRFNEKIDVHQGDVLEIHPIRGEDANGVSRLEVVLTKPRESEIHMEGTTLVIDIAKESSMAEAPSSGMAQEPVSEVQPVPPQPTVMEEPVVMDSLPSASKVTQIRTVSDPQGVKVIIEGDGILKQESFLIQQKRVVIDLLGTSSLLKSHLLPGRDPLLQRIRVGQHLDPKKVRVVLDLFKPVPYHLEEKGKTLVVTLEKPPSSSEARPERVAGAGSTESTGIEAAPGLPAEPSPSVSEGEAPVTPAGPVDRQEKQELKPAAKEIQEPMKDREKRREVAEKGEIIQEKRYTGRKISLDFQDADLTNILRLIADVSGLNVIVGEDVKGKVTLKLINVPWDQALDIILKMNGLGQLRDGNILRIATLGNIAKQQKEEAEAKKATVEAEDLITKIIRVNYSKASELSTTLKKNLSSRGDIQVSDPTNALIIKDIQKNVDEVSELVKKLDLQTPQVMIEARIVQANTTFARDLGVQWGGDFTSSSGSLAYGARGGLAGAPTAPATGFAVNLPASGIAGPLGAGSFTIGRLGRFNLDLRLSAGESTGETKLISTPRITTLDNKEALIQQGESIPFETVSQSGTQTQFVDATLNLTVTPHITPDGSVSMKIKATKNAIGTFRSSITGTPSIDKREAHTEILVKDGETAVIGGIFESTQDHSIAGVPWFYKVPVLGWFFKRDSRSDNRRELLIFITPTIVKVQPST